MRFAMATKKGINISETYFVHHKFYAFSTKKNERSDRIVFCIVLKTKRPSYAVF